uniref:Uncharacterized protein n=1 Tax=Arundo donax TaxID=35708 RepID=A0A0A8Z032_ARUDO
MPNMEELYASMLILIHDTTSFIITTYIFLP